MAVKTEKIISPRVDMISRLSWGAVFGGTAVTVMLLMLLGISIGFFAVEPASEENPFGGVATGSTDLVGFELACGPVFGRLDTDNRSNAVWRLEAKVFQSCQ
jgi:hypothetical protein